MRNKRTLRGAALLAITFCCVSGAQLVFAGEEPAPRILVAGEGKVEIAPDMAVLNLSVMRQASTARAALAANSAAMAKVLDAMMALGIAKQDVQTSTFNIQPRYTNPARQTSGATEARKLVGYSVRNAVTVQVRDISRVGEVLDTSVTLGVNDGGGIEFTNNDPSAAITEARTTAMKKALSKAQTLAKAAGVRVGRVLEISEQHQSPRPMPMARVAMYDAAESVPIAAGTNSYKVTVNVTLAIKQQ
ncbi:MAG: SIMPL domain-containing protein [Halioglobus sp.]|nr:SIMPL domain-containing protein [Halioglobus sp.]